MSGALRLQPSDRQWWTTFWLTNSLDPGRFPVEWHPRKPWWGYDAALCLMAFEENPEWSDDLPMVVVHSEVYYVLPAHPR